MLGALIGCLAFQLDRWCASSDLPTNLSVSCLRYSRTHINNEIRHTTLFLSFRVCAILWCSHHYKRCTALSMHNFSEEMKEKRNRNRIETKRFVCLLDIDFPEVYVWISSNSSDFILLESDEMSEKYQKHIHIIFSLLFIKVSLFGLRISRNWRMWPKHKSKDTHTQKVWTANETEKKTEIVEPMQKPMGRKSKCERRAHKPFYKEFRRRRKTHSAKMRLCVESNRWSWLIK